MPATTINGKTVTVNDEGYLTEFDEWDEDLAAVLAKNIGIELTEAHWTVIRFLRKDFAERGETPTTRRVQQIAGVPIKEQFALFPKKPGRKMSYIAGVPKPHGCV